MTNCSVNQLLRGPRRQRERGFAILAGRWKTLRRSTISPRKIGNVVAAALHLTHFEYRYLNKSFRDHVIDTVNRRPETPQSPRPTRNRYLIPLP